MDIGYLLAGAGCALCPTLVYLYKTMPIGIAPRVLLLIVGLAGTFLSFKNSVYGLFSGSEVVSVLIGLAIGIALAVAMQRSSSQDSEENEQE